MANPIESSQMQCSIGSKLVSTLLALCLLLCSGCLRANSNSCCVSRATGGCTPHAFKRLAPGVGMDFACQQFHAADHDAEQIVEVVRNAAR